MPRGEKFYLKTFTCPHCGAWNRIALGTCDALMVPVIPVKNRAPYPKWHCIECHTPHRKLGHAWTRVLPEESDSIPAVIPGLPCTPES